ncbi:hypothetical protein ACH4RA_16125 [Streptomyces smyrnaeus]|uniref:hypothetical protein n=1 Tax=Streptomyces smyrnaeus TaxID=1387713 RepID=UPI00378BAAED
MGRHKPNHPRRPRPDRGAVMKYVDAYRCGHCHSETLITKYNPEGYSHVNVRHDDDCPVLAGVLSDLPDSLRAAEEAGGTVIIDGGTGEQFTIFITEYS